MKSIPNSQKISIKIPKKGSLGVLALGAVGVTEWRKVKAENASQQKD